MSGTSVRNTPPLLARGPIILTAPAVSSALTRRRPTEARGTVRRIRLRSLRTLERYLSPLVLVVLWQAACSTGLISTRLFASPAQILSTGWGLTQDGSLQANLGVSLLRAVSGLGLALIMGSSLALTAALSRVGENVIDAPIQILRTLPVLALAPLFILWFGIGETPKILLVALGATFPVYLNLHKGIRAIDPKLLEMARTIGLSRWQTVRHVILPGALPDLLLGIRLAVSISWLMLVVAEQINASSGIGHMMMDAQDFLRTDIIFVGLAVYGLLGLLSDQGMRLLERHALAWRLPFGAGAVQRHD